MGIRPLEIAPNSGGSGGGPAACGGPFWACAVRIGRPDAFAAVSSGGLPLREPKTGRGCCNSLWTRTERALRSGALAFQRTTNSMRQAQYRPTRPPTIGKFAVVRACRRFAPQDICRGHARAFSQYLVDCGLLGSLEPWHARRPCPNAAARRTQCAPKPRNKRGNYRHRRVVGRNGGLHTPHPHAQPAYRPSGVLPERADARRRRFTQCGFGSTVSVECELRSLEVLVEVVHPPGSGGCLQKESGVIFFVFSQLSQKCGF